jgi:hypothetical protein
VLNNIDRFILDNFWLCWAITFLWISVAIAFKLWRRSHRGPHFPPLDTVNVIFSERFASGSSHKSLFRRLGGAQNCLSITLTDSELWVTTFFPFTAFAASFDLEHQIPLERLSDVQRNGRNVTIDFATSDGVSRRIVLELRRADRFIKAITSLS